MAITEIVPIDWIKHQRNWDEYRRSIFIIVQIMHCTLVITSELSGLVLTDEVSNENNVIFWIFINNYCRLFNFFFLSSSLPFEVVSKWVKCIRSLMSELKLTQCKPRIACRASGINTQSKLIVECVLLSIWSVQTRNSSAVVSGVISAVYSITNYVQFMTFRFASSSKDDF